ncbi:hypothetical protein [Streptomyces sp. NPDC057838]|uniref:SCO2400 family protein n=1 Tax=unclassified Streptomyces TaxID=2593676 RepID=UPI00368338F9
MDYCSSCRRHLNGALVCPGCGAYAPDIDPSAGDDGTGPASATGTATGTAPVARAVWSHPAPTGTWHDLTVWDESPASPAGPHGAPDGPEGTADAGPSDGHGDPGHGDPGPDAPGAHEARPQGRAARRRQLARWKKNQRRAVVATAVALVGGGLTVTAMNGSATPGVRAATAPQDTTMGGAEGEAPAHAEPPAGQDATPRSSPTGPPRADRASRHQQTRAVDPRTPPAGTRTDAATPPRELPLTTPPRRTTVPGAADTATGTTGTTGTSGSTGSGATEPTTPPAAGADAQQPAPPASDPPPASPTSPTAPPSGQQPQELCLLVICLG